MRHLSIVIYPKVFTRTEYLCVLWGVPLFAVISLTHPIFIWVSNYSRTFYFINSLLMRNMYSDYSIFRMLAF